jgi:hypothetical protein
MSSAPATPETDPAIPPVVWVVFNRPDCAARSLAAIRAARPRRLYVVADGPRPDRAGEAARCAEVRALVDQGVDWPCDVVRDYAPANLGLARRVSSGLDAVFARETEAIILEDDCIPDPTFFPFCAELLERYRDEPRVGQITGCTYQGAAPAEPASYYLSRYPHCWGWATWRRAWRHYDHAMTAWRKPGAHAWLAGRVPDPAERRYWRCSFDATADGRMDSWAYRWTLALWQHDCLSITPYRNLVSNIGFDARATHTREATALTARLVSPMAFPLVHPASLVVDAAADGRTSGLVYRRPSLPARIQRRLQRIFSSVGGGG